MMIVYPMTTAYLPRYVSLICLPLFRMPSLSLGLVVGQVPTLVGSLVHTRNIDTEYPCAN